MTKKKIPSWYTKLEKIVSLTTNTTILILLALGFTEDSLAILIIKIGLSYIMSILSLFVDKVEITEKKKSKNKANLLENEVSEFDDTTFPTEGGPKGPKNP